jgi:hypothetical protein
MTDHYVESLAKLAEEIVSITDITSEFIITTNKENYMEYINFVRKDIIKNTIANLLQEKADSLKQIIQSNSRIQELISVPNSDNYTRSEVDMENYKKELMTDKIAKLEIAIERMYHLVNPN